MSEEARKLNLIEALLKEEDENVLSSVESLLNRNETVNFPKKKFRDFAGILTHEEALEMKRVIEESSEQIDPNEWK